MRNKQIDLITLYEFFWEHLFSWYSLGKK